METTTNHDGVVETEVRGGFRISGATLTKLVRSLYADDLRPEKAHAVLEAAFPDMSKQQRLSILIGAKRLEGDEHGMDLVDDDATETEFGCSLDLTEALGRTQRELDRVRALITDAADFKSGNVTVVGSSEGGVLMPRRRVAPYCKGEVPLSDIKHKLVSNEIGSVYGPIAGRYCERKDDAVFSPAFPVVIQDKITQDSGWLSPEGKFYPCGYMEHIKLAGALGNTESTLEHLGWIKLSMGHPPLQGNSPPTQAQIDRLFDHLGTDMPYWAKEETK